MPATSFDPRSSTPTGVDFPLHRLNSPQTVIWLSSPFVKKQIATNLLRRYPGGYGVLSATQRLIAKVDPRGNVQELPFPHRRFEMWQIANQPRQEECPCARFFDPEVGGEWRGREGSRGHHPFCQFDRTANEVFLRASQEANSRIGIGEAPQERPDEWLRMREEAKK